MNNAMQGAPSDSDGAPCVERNEVSSYAEKRIGKKHNLLDYYNGTAEINIERRIWRRAMALHVWHVVNSINFNSISIQFNSS